MEEGLNNNNEKPAQIKRGVDIKWLASGLIAALGLMVGIVANIGSSENETDIVSGLIDIDNGELKINWDKYKTHEISLPVFSRRCTGCRHLDLIKLETTW